MPKRKVGFEAGKSTLTVAMRSELADALAARALTDRRNQSATLDLMIEHYLSTRTLQPLPENMKAHRNMVGGGETKLRRYSVEPKTVRLLQEAEALGYSQSYVIEESVKEGLVEKEATNAAS